MINLEQRISRFWYPTEPYKGIQRIIHHLSLPLVHQVDRKVKQRMARRVLLERTEAKPWIVVVGNITVGGTGKTPAIIGLTEWLQQRGYRVGIVSRGYRKGGFPKCASSSKASIVVTPASAAEAVGDEPLLLAERTGVPVVINPQRNYAVETLQTQFPEIEIILSDDGLQHYAMARHLEIAVIDAARGFGNGLLLPGGPLREPITRLQSVSALLCNSTAGLDEHPLLKTQLPPAAVQGTFTLQSSGLYRILDDAPVAMPYTPVIAITGIGNPQRFFQQLVQQDLVLNHAHALPDHHAFTPDDFKHFTPSMPIVMTEKDSVKCRGFAKSHWYYLKVDTQFNAAFIQFLEETFPSKI